MKNVIHFARKLLPPTASFIYNQFTNHIRYDPVYIYCEEVASGFTPLIKDNYPVIKVVEGEKDYWLYHLLRRLTERNIRKGLSTIENYKPDLYHFHYGVDTLVFLPFLQRMRVPNIVSFYGYDCTSFPKRFWGYGRELLRSNIFNNDLVDYITAMSPDMKNDLVALGCPPEKIITHYHGINTRPFQKNRKYNEKSNINLLIVSGLAEKKGHLFLLKAFQKAKSMTSTRINLTIVGSGPMESEIRSHIEENRIEDVSMQPAVNFGSSQHLDFLSAADIFVHPSITPENGDKEGIPGALVEAMASGLPVISTYHAGIPYLIAHQENGWLVNENDVDALAAAIQNLSQNTAVREKIGINAQQFATQELDISIKQQQLEKIYERAAARLIDQSNKVVAG